MLILEAQDRGRGHLEAKSRKKAETTIYIMPGLDLDHAGIFFRVSQIQPLRPRAGKLSTSSYNVFL